MYRERIAAIRKRLTEIEIEVEDLDHYQTKDVEQFGFLPSKHGKPWSGFEKGLLKEELSALASKLARQFGRSEISILLHFHSYISRGMKDA